LDDPPIVYAAIQILPIEKIGKLMAGNAVVKAIHPSAAQHITGFPGWII
jgi:hypothetical protein